MIITEVLPDEYVGTSEVHVKVKFLRKHHMLQIYVISVFTHQCNLKGSYSRSIVSFAAPWGEN